ncbi:MAG: hypothetical protein WEF53_03990 [Bacteroidota bacterium]
MTQPTPPTESQPSERQKKRYEVSLDTRKFEIDLFWRRALFFWGFIASAFVAYAAFSKDRPDGPTISLIISLFGLVCSFSWTLVNRGSKYWQENWESQVDKDEDAVTGPLFKQPAERQKKGWFGAQKFSVSKLAIALSDYVTLVWALLILRSVREIPTVKRFLEADCWPFHLQDDTLVLVFLVFTLAWLIFVFIKSGTTERTPGAGGASTTV